MKFSFFAPSRFLAAVLGWMLLPLVGLAQTNLPNAQVGQNYSFQVVTNPPAAAGTVYNATGLPTGVGINASSGLISGTPTAAGVFNGSISLVSSTTNTFAIRITVNPAAGTPAITSVTTANGTVGQAFTAYTVTANPAALSFNVGALPPGLTFNGTQISGTPTLAGAYAVSLSGNNASGTGAATQLNITIAAATGTPVVATSPAPGAATPNTAYSYQIVATNGPTSYAVSGLPVGLSVNAGTGLISGTPTVAGVYALSVTAANGSGTSAAVTLPLVVGVLPAITSAATASGNVGSAFSYSITASGAPTSYNVSGLPAGLSVNGATGVISGTPTAAGTSSIQLSANNALGQGPTATLALTVSPAIPPTVPPIIIPPIIVPPSSNPPTITAQPGSQSVTVGSNVTLSVSASGASLNYLWRKDGVLLLGITTSTLTLTNVQPADAGTYTVAVANGGGSVTSEAAIVTVTPAIAPAIAAQPVAQTTAPGGNVTFRITATGTNLSYQWRKDGAAIAGATSNTLILDNVQAAAGGAYSVVVSNSLGSVTSNVANLTIASSRLVNISVRSAAGTGDQTLIVGFAIGGTGTKQVLLRGAGPSLAQFGVSGPLADPQLRLFNQASVQTNFNDDWGGGATLSAAFTQVGAFAFAPATSKDAAMQVPIQPGTNSAHVTTPSGSGVAILEAYDADVGVSGSRFTNLSARSQVGAGENILIAGFVIDGIGPKRLLLRGAGPALAQFGLSGLLARPQLALYAGTTVVSQNSGWSTSTNAATIADTAVQAGAFAFGATSLDAAMLVELQPGAYTLQLSGVSNTTGVALVEVYELP